MTMAERTINSTKSHVITSKPEILYQGNLSASEEELGSGATDWQIQIVGIQILQQIRLTYQYQYCIIAVMEPIPM